MLLLLLWITPFTAAFHDCVQPAKGRRLPPSFGGVPININTNDESECAGGLCVGTSKRYTLHASGCSCSYVRCGFCDHSG